MTCPPVQALAQRKCRSLPWLLGVVLVLQACSRAVCPIHEETANPISSVPPSSFRSVPGGVAVAEKPLSRSQDSRTVTHEVAPLETLWRISKMYDVPVESICAANGIKPTDPILVGQNLTIPHTRCFRHIIALYPNPRWTHIVIHHTATDIGKAILIHRSHHDRGFWHGLGYHFLIDNGTLGKGDGQIEEAPRWIKQQTGAHCKANGMNEKAIGIALVGNFNEDLPTPRQLDSLLYLLDLLTKYYRIPPDHILGHRDVPGANTDCPGSRFPWPKVRRVLTAR
ncbi:MAG: N-acetylmuramoyl-L-alanine amidase [Syntrophobacteraceae bacterium]|nr:N-acetylmuramoyl-L-alanine amidase [Syntrophobacteraceae bacterium]